MSQEREVRGVSGVAMVFLLPAPRRWLGRRHWVLREHGRRCRGVRMGRPAVGPSAPGNPRFPRGLYRGRPQRGSGRHAVRRLQGLDQGARILVGESAHDSPTRLAARPQLRKRQAEGQRPRRQPDRNRRGRRVAHRRHVRGRVQRGRLRALRARAERVGRAHPGDHVPLRFARRRTDVAALVGRRDRATGCATRSRNGWRRPASK